MPRLKSLSVMSDVISDASLRLAGSSAPQKFPARNGMGVFGILFLAICSSILLSACAGSDGQKDDTDIWSESKLYSEATDKLNDFLPANFRLIKGQPI